LQGYGSPAWRSSGGGSFSFLSLLLASSVFLSLGGGDEGENPWWLGFSECGHGGFIGEALGFRGDPDAEERRKCDGLAGRTHGIIKGLRARVFPGAGGSRARRESWPTARAEAGVSRAGGRREMRSARCRVAPRGESRGARVVVRRKGKLTGGARLSVTLGGERARHSLGCGNSFGPG